MSELKVVLVGCGRIAQAHAKALQCAPELRLCGVCDVDAGAAARFGREWDVPSFGDIENLLVMTRPDAAILCAPPLYHPSLAAKLLESHLHVLCEKPLAITPQMAQVMADVARAHDRVLMMASKFRFCDGVRAAREAVQAGTLGALTRCAVTFCAPVDMSGRWNSDPQIAGGGVLMDNGPHALDIVRFVLGGAGDMLHSAQAKVTLDTTSTSLPVETGALLTLEGSDMPHCEVTLSWTAPAPDQTFLHIVGDAATLAVAWNGTWLSSPDGQRKRMADGYDKDAAFAQQLAYFGACMRGEDTWQLALDDALWGVRAIETAYRAARESQALILSRILPV